MTVLVGVHVMAFTAVLLLLAPASGATTATAFVTNSPGVACRRRASSNGNHPSSSPIVRFDTVSSSLCATTDGGGGGEEARSSLGDSPGDDVTIDRRGWFRRAAASTIGAASAAAAAAALRNPSPAAAAESSTLLIESPAATTTATRTPSALCDPTVSSWARGERVVHVLGTAHISSSSANLAGRLVREVKPDAVFVELDAKRVGRATGGGSGGGGGPTVERGGERRRGPVIDIGEIGPTAWGGDAMGGTTAATTTAATASATATAFDPFGLRERVAKASSDVVGGAIRDLYKKLEAEGFSAGEEFVVAVREGLSVGSTIVLGDRDVDVTLKRLTEALAKTDLKKLISADIDMERDLQDQLPDSVKEWQRRNEGPGGQFDAEQLRVFVETLKTKENVKKIMGTFREAAPEIYTAMVAERDEFMADGLNRLNQFGSIVAVMGIAHTEGVEAYLQGVGWRPLPVKC